MRIKSEDVPVLVQIGLLIALAIVLTTVSARTGIARDGRTQIGE